MGVMSVGVTIASSSESSESLKGVNLPQSVDPASNWVRD